jgi:hypothetical protein
MLRRLKATVLVALHRFDLVDRPVAVPGGEDVLVRVRDCGISSRRPGSTRCSSGASAIR